MDEPVDHAIALFHRVAADVPAYRAFLAEHGVDPAGVRTREDFERLPLVTKANYTQRHPLPDLCRGGTLASVDTVAVSSGSTGEPSFWPRSAADEQAIAARFEQVFVDGFEADRKRTLAVVCFPLGTWVGGMFTAACCRHLAARGLPILTVTPGNVKAEILRVVARLAPLFEQTVLLGYPPFLKDVIDSGRGWDAHHVRLVMAGEVFTEEWRTLMGERAGIADLRHHTASLYGTADAGVLGNETAVSVAIRRFLAARPDDARAIFGQARLPTLCQYDPRARYFEARDGTLLFTGDNGIPLVRYHISDHGGVHGFDELVAKVRALGFDPLAGARVVREQPFVHVFGRSHFAISYFGANVFPEMVSPALEQPAIAPHVTGKFVMEIVRDADENVGLQVTVELAGGDAGSDALAAEIAAAIHASLLRLDPEFAAYVPADRQRPRVTLLPAGDPAYFPVDVKHRYSR
jgi:phenylacetate-CoA ligase